MAVSLYFGLPGAGKTTMMVYKALQARKSGRYEHIYCNVHIAVPDVIYIDNGCIGKYDLSDCLILIDEATLFADSRDFKNFGKDRLTYFLEHRHFNADIILFTQQWDGVDRKIRVITDRVYYVYKGVVLGRWFTRCYRIPYGIIIPDPRKDGSEKLGEIVQGYAKPNVLIRLFSPWLYRPAYYKYFDSWEKPELPQLPERYSPYPAPEEDVPENRFKRLLGNLRAERLRCMLSRLKGCRRAENAEEPLELSSVPDDTALDTDPAVAENDAFEHVSCLYNDFR